MSGMTADETRTAPAGDFNIKVDVDGTITDREQARLNNTSPASLALFIKEAENRLHKWNGLKHTADIYAAAELLADRLVSLIQATKADDPAIEGIITPRVVLTVAARRAFIDNEVKKLGSQRAVEFLHELHWPVIQEWITGSTQAKLEILITDFHKANRNSRAWDEISKHIGTLVRRFRNLDRAFLEAGR